MIEIIKEKEKWDSLVNSSDHADFYHTYDYHQLSKREEERPILLHYTQGDITIFVPLLARDIEGTSYKDLTSVYGYPGPITIGITENFDNTNFRKELQELFLKHKIVSVFSRLNPFIPYQYRCLQDIGEISTLGNVVNIDLTKNLEEQRQQYQRRLKTYINQSRRYCSVIKTRSDCEIQKFMDLYYENMRRVNATQNYFFKKEYFHSLMNSNDFKTEILFAVHKETQEIIAGAMFVKKDHIVQYHLSGCKEEHLDLNPVKLLIDEMRMIASSENYTFFNLGGGLGGREDSLFRFKAGFSKDFRPFSVWKYIVNEPVYTDLVNEIRLKEPEDVVKQYLGFFPSYRTNSQN